MFLSRENLKIFQKNFGQLCTEMQNCPKAQPPPVRTDGGCLGCVKFFIYRYCDYLYYFFLRIFMITKIATARVLTPATTQMIITKIEEVSGAEYSLSSTSN